MLLTFNERKDVAVIVLESSQEILQMSGDLNDLHADRIEETSALLRDQLNLWKEDEEND